MSAKAAASPEGAFVQTRSIPPGGHSPEGTQPDEWSREDFNPYLLPG